MMPNDDIHVLMLLRSASQCSKEHKLAPGPSRGRVIETRGAVPTALLVIARVVRRPGIHIALVTCA